MTLSPTECIDNNIPIITTLAQAYIFKFSNYFSLKIYKVGYVEQIHLKIVIVSFSKTGKGYRLYTF